MHYMMPLLCKSLHKKGNAENYQAGKKEEKHSSPFCFHKAAVDIYEYLGDAWSCFIVVQFQKGVYGDRMKRNLLLHRPETHLGPADI